MALRNYWCLGWAQNINIDRSLKEVGFNPNGWLGAVQDFSRESSYRWGGNRKRTGIRTGSWDMTEFLQPHD